MKTIHLSMIAVLFASVFSVGEATAQALYGSQQALSSVYNRPTVSPYLNLTLRDSQVGLPSYYTQVRPEVERRQQEVAQQRQTQSIQRDLNAVRNNIRQQQQDQSQAFTTGNRGWSQRGLPRHGSTLNYYPGFSQIPRRR